ncbi:MAG: hypothetical protein WA005_03455 [Candidatus Binataceae bacterium]
MDEIETHCKAGRLFLVEPLRKEFRAERERTIYALPNIYEFLHSDRWLAPQTEADFSDFIRGKDIYVALELDHQDCFMARLEKAAEEVWEIRIWEPGVPQLRFFGRFAHQDVFVVLLGPMKRWKLLWRDYKWIKRECISEWQRLFGLRPPVMKGDNIHAYISKNVNLV